MYLDYKFHVLDWALPMQLYTMPPSRNYAIHSYSLHATSCTFPKPLPLSASNPNQHTSVPLIVCSRFCFTPTVALHITQGARRVSSDLIARSDDNQLFRFRLVFYKNILLGLIHARRFFLYKYPKSQVRFPLSLQSPLPIAYKNTVLHITQGGGCGMSSDVIAQSGGNQSFRFRLAFCRDKPTARFVCTFL